VEVGVGSVIIGMDPHKRSATIEVIDERETVLAQGRFGTDSDGYRMMLVLGGGSGSGSGRWRAATASVGTLSQRLVADGETVLDVPAKLSAWAWVFATGQGRKSDAVDAHGGAVAALRAKGLRQGQR
jgi:transposase